ncbi:S24 family peptidase [Campylobacter coli]|nr:S24 family peptidase [Campylobacter coli]MCC2588242.1 S24 family peptidase [Campylobacter coli]
MDYIFNKSLFAKRKKELNLTNKDIAKKLNLTKEAIDSWGRIKKNGKIQQPDFGLIPDLADLLKVDKNDLGKCEHIEKYYIEKKDKTFYKLDKEYLSQILKEKKISRAKFAQMLSENGYEITLDGITYWYRGENNQPEDYKNIITMAKVLEVPVSKLAPVNDSIKSFLQDDNQINFRYFPDIYASAGLGTSSQSEEVKIVSVDENFLKEILDIPIKKSYDIIKINGDSMEPILSNGDFIIIDRSKNSLETISNADIVIFRKNDDLFCKKIKKEPFADYIFLVSENKKYEDKKVDNSEFEQCEILGAVVSKMAIETFKNFIEFVR